MNEGISGIRTFRPALDAMMEAAKLGKVDVIAYLRLDRLGRSLPRIDHDALGNPLPPP